MLKKRLYITGATGFIGAELVSTWLMANPQNSVIVQTRDFDKAELRFRQWRDRVEFVNQFAMVKSPSDILAIINLAGSPIADTRWSPSSRNVIENSRIGLTKQLADDLKNSGMVVPVFISASAIGFYDHNNEIVDESSAMGNGYASNLCNQWEKEAKGIKDNDLCQRLAILRIGIVLGAGGGILKKMLPIYRLCAGGRIGSGTQGMSWIHVGDLVSLILMVIEDSRYSGVINAVSPHPVTQQDFSKALSKKLNRPAWFLTPAWLVKVMFGQMGEELLLGGQFVQPSILRSLGYEYKYRDLDRALEQILSN